MIKSTPATGNRQSPQGFLKEWMFARMTMLTLLGELKRLQVQVALLDEKRG